MHSTVAIRAAITVAAIILVLIVSRAIRRFRARGLRKMWSILFGRHDPESRGQVPVFRVVALGLAGSGKTVFFASMFHALSVPRLGRSYFLETDVRQRVALGATYKQVASIVEPWPRGTWGMTLGSRKGLTTTCG